MAKPLAPLFDPDPQHVEPHCPARLARFRLETDSDGSTGALLGIQPQTPLPCVESIERPGRCVHCYQAIERAAGAPHGPYCTGDSRCRECARVAREARPAAPTGEQWALSAEVLETWRADADRWRRFGVMPAAETTLACQRIATLIDALNDSRNGGELAGALLDKAAELEKRLEAIRAELWQLCLPRRAFSSRPVQIDHTAPFDANGDARGTAEDD